jgi:hypothetical protein
MKSGLGKSAMQAVAECARLGAARPVLGGGESSSGLHAPTLLWPATPHANPATFIVTGYRCFVQLAITGLQPGGRKRRVQGHLRACQGCDHARKRLKPFSAFGGQYLAEARC